MKKIVIISSSPRAGGNSDLLCDRFAAGAREAGHQVEKFRLAERKIGFCLGCYACKDSGVCFQKDGAREVIDAMMAADVIVLATPVYFYTVSAQLKTLIDRTVVVYPNLTGKTFYSIMTMWDPDAAHFEGTRAALKGFRDCYDGSVLAGEVAATNVYEKGDVRNSPAWDEAYALGKSVR
ncbi:MAG: flavodoxin family protein [Kiritimatiellia bacterium]